MTLRDLVPLSPAAFFALQLPCHPGRKLEKKHKLPDLFDFHGIYAFGDLFLGWSKEGLSLSFETKLAFNFPNPEDFRSGDSIELFFDTRDVKTSGFPTRFCHHFLFLPENQEGYEITRLRPDEMRPLCEPDLLQCKKSKGRKTKIEIFIPREALFGYEPARIPKLGFTYRINRALGEPQCFATSPEDFSIEKHPSLWASLTLEDT